jgi:hypothetical protein
VFPAHAGMNRSIPNLISPPKRVPRTRGDEPNVGHSPLVLDVAPHAGRGLKDYSGIVGLNICLQYQRTRSTVSYSEIDEYDSFEVAAEIQSMRENRGWVPNFIK